ncbi:MAG TPA: IS110 family transposase [Actinomycetota bacterium]|nr:IS110 family transposase [Actinomycetota bacterium]
MTILADDADVVIGVDTHKHTHSAAVVGAQTGAVIAELTVSADPDGYHDLLDLANAHGHRRAWSIEGTGGYGAGLARFLLEAGERVIELDRPHRTPRRGGAKSDPIDAVRAAREALGRTKLAEPKIGGERAALAALLAARRSAVDSCTDVQRQLHALIVPAPEALRQRFRGYSTVRVVQHAARLRIDERWAVEMKTTAQVLRTLARRALALGREAKEHEAAIGAIVRAWRPDLLTQLGVGPIVAATVLCAWSHPRRFRSEAAFAMLAGVAPIPASSGVTNRHRLNRFGDRQLNRALHTVVINRIRLDPATQAYVEVRTKEGKSSREIKRCLKRYVARQLYRQLEHPPLDRS